MGAETSASTLVREVRRIALKRNPGALPLIGLAATASRVVVEEHPLGMLAVHFKLATCAVRLHIWTPITNSFRDDLSQRHDHIWHLESFVLLGSVSHEVYDLVDDPTGDEVWLHDYPRHELRASGRRTRLVSKYEECIDAGQRYLLPAGVVHQTQPAASSTVTLVLASPSGRTQARIIGDLAQEKPPAATRRLETLERAIQVLQQAERG